MDASHFSSGIPISPPFHACKPCAIMQRRLAHTSGSWTGAQPKTSSIKLSFVISSFMIMADSHRHAPMTSFRFTAASVAASQQPQRQPEFLHVERPGVVLVDFAEGVSGLPLGSQALGEPVERLLHESRVCGRALAVACARGYRAACGGRGCPPAGAARSPAAWQRETARC